MQRARAHAEIVALVEATGMPCATLTMGRTALDEHHPAHVGVYDGRMSCPVGVKELVESSDCLICVGAVWSDYNTGGFTAKLEQGHIVDIKLRHTVVKKARFDDIRSVDVLRALAKHIRHRSGAEAAYWSPRAPGNNIIAAPPAPPGSPVHSDAFLSELQRLLSPGDLLLTETFTLTFAAIEMRIPSGVTFITQALWGSIGFATPAAGGAVRALAKHATEDATCPGRRVVLVTGDGSLQMTAAALADMLRDKLAPLIFVINNDG